MTQQSPLQPTPVGAIRFNTDSSKLEYYDGNQWVNISSTSPEVQTGGARGVMAGGVSGDVNVIQYFQIETTGNSIDYGDLVTGSGYKRGSASRTRGIYSGGWEPAASATDIEYITIASTGNAIAFGQCTGGTQGANGASSETRAIVHASGSVPGGSANNTIEYVTISSLGNGIDFGDKTSTASAALSCGSPTRGLFAGGYVSPTTVNTIEYITI